MRKLEYRVSYFHGVIGEWSPLPSAPLVFTTLGLARQIEFRERCEAGLAATSKHKPFEICNCARPELIYHCAAQLPESINAVASWVAKRFGDDEGFMNLGKREGYAFDLFAELAKAGLGVKRLTKREVSRETS